MKTSLSYLVLVLCGVCPSWSKSQQTHDQDIFRVALTIRDEARIQVPNFSSVGNVCDPTGQPYFQLSDASYSVNAVLRMRSNGNDPAPIPFPTGFDKKGQWHFAIDPTGKLYMLLSGVSDSLLFEVDASGQELNRLHVKLPLWFHVENFAVESSGRSVVFGSIEKAYEETGKGSSEPYNLVKDLPYLFWVDRDGSARKQRSGDEFSSGVTMEDGIVAASKSQHFYFATSKAIKEYSPTGEFVKSFPVNAPASHSRTAVLQVQDGVIAVQYIYPSDEVKPNEPYFGNLEETWLLMNPVTGDPIGYFDKPSGFKGSALCYEGQRSFLYFTAKNGQSFLVTAQP